MLSNCCNAPLITHQSDEGTGYYQCSECLQPCDPMELLRSIMPKLTIWPDKPEPRTDEEILQAAKEARMTFEPTNQNDGNLPEELFCKCKHGRPCFDTRFNIQKWHEEALTNARREEWELFFKLCESLIGEGENQAYGKEDGEFYDGFQEGWNRALREIKKKIREAQSSEEQK